MELKWLFLDSHVFPSKYSLKRHQIMLKLMKLYCSFIHSARFDLEAVLNEAGKHQWSFGCCSSIGSLPCCVQVFGTFFLSCLVMIECAFVLFYGCFAGLRFILMELNLIFISLYFVSFSLIVWFVSAMDKTFIVFAGT